MAGAKNICVTWKLLTMVSVWFASYFSGSSQIERLDTSYENLVVKICLPQDTLFCMKEICIKFLEALSKSRFVCLSV